MVRFTRPLHNHFQGLPYQAHEGPLKPQYTGYDLEYSDHPIKFQEHSCVGLYNYDSDINL